MTKKESLVKLKKLFRDPLISISKLKEVRDLYNEIKNLSVADNADIPKEQEQKIASL